MTHPLAALLDGVPRYSFTGKKLQETGWMHEDAVLSALEAVPVPPDLVERAHLDVARLQSGLDNCDRDSGGLELGGVVVTMKEAADRIRALIALATAQQAQIAGLREKHIGAERVCDLVDNKRHTAETEAATLRSEVERLRDRLARMEGAIECARGLVDTPIARRKLNLSSDDPMLLELRAAYPAALTETPAALEGKHE